MEKCINISNTPWLSGTIWSIEAESEGLTMEEAENSILLKQAAVLLDGYRKYLEGEERSGNTIDKYIRDVKAFLLYMGEKPLTRELLLSYKEQLIRAYAANSVNSMLAAINSFLGWQGHPDYRVKLLKIQREIFLEPEKELAKEDYEKLVRAAAKRGNERLSFVMQTICATGIRVSELKYITFEAVCAGRAEVNSKGKRRTVFLPDKLCRLLMKYMKRRKIAAGPVFITKNGKPLDRCNIWRDMKLLCESAQVASQKVFPHNLRHLFARIYYSLEKDLSRLADILGHTNINTTRIYTAESGRVHVRQMARMGLVIT